MQVLGYVGRKLGEANPFDCDFANYLAELFARYLAYRCHFFRPLGQLLCCVLQSVDLENLPHLQIKTRFEVDRFRR